MPKRRLGFSYYVSPPLFRQHGSFYFEATSRKLPLKRDRRYRQTPPPLMYFYARLAGFHRQRGHRLSCRQRAPTPKTEACISGLHDISIHENRVCA